MQVIDTRHEMQISIDIEEFNSNHQEAVENLVLPIQQLEFGVPITREDQPDLMYIKDTFQTGSGNFWVTIHNGTVIGTVGVVDIGNHQVALKKMFVRREYRGKQYGVAKALMEHAKHWCEQHDIRQILLGTITPMKAAHRFYEKNGFSEIAAQALPPSFPLVHVDTKFYQCDLGAG